MFQLVETLEAQMGEFFPEISTQKSLVMKVIEEEEQSFLRTLAQGLAKLHDFIAEGSKTLDGKRAFELYDTYGFPIDLTELIMRENDKVVDLAEFTAEMTAQKERSRAATKLSTDDWTVLEDDETQEFVGYDYTSAEVRITRYRKVSAKNKAFYQLVLSLTPFYPEGGGQLGDTGILVQGDQKIGIFDTKKENGIIVHFTKELPSDLSGSWSAEVSESKRRETAKNHSATHLMHEALREVLGTHVEQKGSLVTSEYLRFDFSHFQKVSDEELQQIESLVNQRIQANLPLEEFRNIPISEAKDMGAMMLFGEKYGDTVRAIKFGSSIELCGGIHVQATGSIGLFKFISEGAVAAGMRRVEAVTGMGAMKYINDSLSALRDAAEVLKNPKNLAGAIQQLKEKEAASQKEVEAFRKEKAMAAADELENNAEDHGGVRVIAARTAMDAGSVKDMVFKLKGQGNTLVIFANAWEGKATVSIGISDEVVADKGWHAGDAVRALAQHIQGGGGGQPAFATAGGNNPEGLDKVLSDWKNHFAL